MLDQAVPASKMGGIRTLKNRVQTRNWAECWDEKMQPFDYIIIGGGSAGCVLADRLSASGRHRVLMLEAGPTDRRFWVRVPIGYGVLFHQKAVNWMYQTDPEPGLDGRSVYHPRGKLLGGSSSINALVYHRGQAGDYDDWAAAGNKGWDYESLRSTFDAIETHNPADPEAPHLTLTDNTADCHPLGSDFANVCHQGQLPWRETPLREGEGVSSYLTTTRNGMRCSSAVAFLAPAMKRSNLQVVTGAHVTGIGFEDGRASKVTYRHRGKPVTVQANAEILLAAGAVGSPQLLQLSGVGDSKHLRNLGIDVTLDQPHVGQHLQDHYGINYIFKARQKTLNDIFGKWQGRIMAGLRYVLTRRGPLALSVNQFGGLVHSRPGLDRPDTQIYLNPMSYQSFYKGRRRMMKPDAFSGFIIGFNSCRPKSEGSISIRSTRSDEAPCIQGNYLTHKDDISEGIAMARLVERLQETPALQHVLADTPLTPLSQMSDEEVVHDLKERGGTVFHLCGTCRMGTSPRTSVVDSRLRVHGLRGLRVCDASVFPNITSANTNAPTMMLAHRAADLILEDTA